MGGQRCGARVDTHTAEHPPALHNSPTILICYATAGKTLICLVNHVLKREKHFTFLVFLLIPWNKAGNHLVLLCCGHDNGD